MKARQKFSDVLIGLGYIMSVHAKICELTQFSRQKPEMISLKPNTHSLINAGKKSKIIISGHRTILEQGGFAFTDILFGSVNLSGRGYYHKFGIPKNQGRDYVFSSTAPLFPFSYGLSYNRF